MVAYVSRPSFHQMRSIARTFPAQSFSLETSLRAEPPLNLASLMHSRLLFILLLVILSFSCEGSWRYWVGIVVAILLRFLTSFRMTNQLSSWALVAKDLYSLTCHPELWLRRILKVLGRNRCGNTAEILHFVQNDKPAVILSFSCEGSLFSYLSSWALVAKDLDGTESESLWQYC